MKITVGEKTYPFDVNSLTNKECMDIERVTGMGLTQFRRALNGTSMIAMTAMVWIVARREDATVEFDDVEFTVDDLDVDLSDEAPAADPTEAGSDPSSSTADSATSSPSPDSSESSETVGSA